MFNIIVNHMNYTTGRQTVTDQKVGNLADRYIADRYTERQAGR